MIVPLKCTCNGLLHRCSEGCQCIVVVRWTGMLPIELPYLKQPTCFCSVTGMTYKIRESRWVCPVLPVCCFLPSEVDMTVSKSWFTHTSWEVGLRGIFYQQRTAFNACSYFTYYTTALKRWVWALSSFREKKASGFQLPSRNCSRTPPTAKSDASTVMQVVAVALGWLSRVAETSACFVVSNADWCWVVHWKSWSFAIQGSPTLIATCLVGCCPQWRWIATVFFDAQISLWN